MTFREFGIPFASKVNYYVISTNEIIESRHLQMMGPLTISQNSYAQITHSVGRN